MLICIPLHRVRPVITHIAFVSCAVAAVSPLPALAVPSIAIAGPTASTTERTDTPTDASLLTVQREAEARKAVAEAERAELLARLPPSSSKPLAGAVDTRQLGAAGLVKAFDLAQQLAAHVCAALPADARVVIYDPASTQGIVAARTVNDTLARLADDLSRQNKDLQLFIDKHTPPGSTLATIPLALLAVVPATMKAAADVASVFKSDVTASGITYGEGARELFVTSLGRTCPARIAGTGSGYLGELDPALHEKLLARVRTLAAQRGEYANRISIVQRLADAAKGDEKRDLASVANAGGAVLKTVDTFLDSLKAGDASDRSPLFNAVRYLGYANRTAGSLVLDFDLRLEGLTIVKDGLFSGQRLRLSGVAFLWYRVYEPNGTLRMADAVRRITEPVEVDLRGREAGGQFWDAGQKQ
jgi:hypothetical protein